MSKPTFRNPDKLQLLPFREWIRNNLPPGSQGTVVEDLDLVMRVYGSNYGTDADGKFMLLELKYRNAWIGRAQQKTFGLIHNLLKKADPLKERYVGYFVVQYSCEDWDKSRFRVNRADLSKQEFIRFLQFDKDVLGSIPGIKL